MQRPVKLSDDSNFLMLELDRVLTDYLQESGRCDAAEVFIVHLVLHGLEHPKNGMRVDDIFLAF